MIAYLIAMIGKLKAAIATISSSVMFNKFDYTTSDGVTYRKCGKLCIATVDSKVIESSGTVKNAIPQGYIPKAIGHASLTNWAGESTGRMAFFTNGSIEFRVEEAGGTYYGSCVYILN